MSVAYGMSPPPPYGPTNAAPGYPAIRAEKQVVPTPAWCRFLFWAQIPLLVLMPLQPTLGRALLGVGGWMTVLLLLRATGPLLIYQIVLLVLTATLGRSKVGHRTFLPVTAITFLAYLVCFYLATLALPDASDAPGTIPSVLMRLGMPENTSWWVCKASAIMAVVLALVTLVMAIFKKPRGAR